MFRFLFPGTSTTPVSPNPENSLASPPVLVLRASDMVTKASPGREILIAVMGVTGAGKSYFIREVSGHSEVKVSGGLHSCTSKVDSYSFQRGGAKITLVDTPGFNDTTRSDTEVLTEICNWTSKTFKEKRLLSGIIYLHRITDVRMDGSALKNLRMFQKLCGPGALKNVFLTTTQWSNVIDQGDGENRERALCEEGNFWGTLIKKGATLKRFHGTKESGLELIDKLIPNQQVALDIQDQIVTQKRTIVETDAGQCINAELIAQEKKYKKEIETLERERQAAISEKDDEMKELLAEEQAKAQEKLEKAAAEKLQLEKLHAEEMRKRDLERQKDEKRRREEQKKAQEELERVRRHEQERAEAEARRLREAYENERRERENNQGVAGVDFWIGPLNIRFAF
ncbi:P-loop containing nucleoside triphosphate hydrolase protein [Tuber brumale]|nr:P-loop containing nucleoside triphosphate hydrolase protein [Tuber brumale]